MVCKCVLLGGDVKCSLPILVWICGGLGLIRVGNSGEGVPVSINRAATSGVSSATGICFGAEGTHHMMDL